MEEKEIQPKRKSLVTIKGSNEGLSFILNDEEPFSYVAEELKQKVRRELSTLLTGPMVRIKIDCGSRELNDKQRKLLEEIISLKDNLILTRINSSSLNPSTISPNNVNSTIVHPSEQRATEVQPLSAQGKDKNTPVTSNQVVHMVEDNTASIHRGTIRSGQIVEHDGNIVIFGDVNAGAKVIATGDIMVLGMVNGSVHAGCKGDKQRIVVAASWGNSQVRIADCIGKTQVGDNKNDQFCLATAYIDEYRIQFKHKRAITV